MKPMQGKMVPKMRPGMDGDMMSGRSKGDGITKPRVKKGKKVRDPFNTFDAKTLTKLKGAI